MSRRESRSSLGIRQNDALVEFENFKKRFLLANKHITRLNSTLSARIEELNAQISVLRVENLRLRASEIALTSQLKRERQRSSKTNDGNAAPPTPPSPKARSPPTKTTDPVSPQFRTARPPTLPAIYENEGPSNPSAGEQEKTAIGEISRSKLPIPMPEKPIRRPGGLLDPNLESFAPLRSRSPTFGSPIPLEASLPQEEEEFVVKTVAEETVAVNREKRVRKSVNYAEPKLNTKMRKPDLPPGSEPSRRKSSSAAKTSTQRPSSSSTATDAPQDAIVGANSGIAQPSQTSHLALPLRAPNSNRIDSVNSPITPSRPGSEAAMYSPDPPSRTTGLTSSQSTMMAASSSATVVTELHLEADAKSISQRQFLRSQSLDSSPSSRDSSPSRNSSNPEPAEKTKGREKRVRKSGNYSKRKLNTKMRKPDLPPGSEPSRKKRLSAARTSTHRPSLSTTVTDASQDAIVGTDAAAAQPLHTSQLKLLLRTAEDNLIELEKGLTLLQSTTTASFSSTSGTVVADLKADTKSVIQHQFQSRSPSLDSLPSRGSSPSRNSSSPEPDEEMNGRDKPATKSGNYAKRRLNIKMRKPDLSPESEHGQSIPPPPTLHVRSPRSREPLADYDIPSTRTVSQATPEPDPPSPTIFAHAEDGVLSHESIPGPNESIVQSEVRPPLNPIPKYIRDSTEWIFDYGIEYNSEDDFVGASMDVLVEKMRLQDTSFILPFITSTQIHADNPNKGSMPPSDPLTTNPDTGSTWKLNNLRQSIQTSESVGDFENNISSEQIHGQTDAHPLFSVQSFEPQVKGLSSDIIVTLGALPEDTAETLFTADIGIPSTPSQCTRRLSFHSDASFTGAGLDSFPHEIFEHQSSSSCETFETVISEELDFRVGNKSSRSSVIDGIWDRLSISSQETFETVHEPTPELLLALGLHLDVISRRTPLSTNDADSASPGIMTVSRNEGPSHKEESADSENAVSNSKIHSALDISFIRDVSNVSIDRSHINFTTNVMEQVDDVRVGLHTLYSRSDPTALHNSYERQKTINQQMKALRGWGSQLLITSSSTFGEYPLSVPSIKTRDLEEVVKDVFTWLYSVSSPHSIMWLYDEDEGYDGNLRTSLIGQCLANFLGERRDLTASYFFKKCSPYSRAGTSYSGTDGKDTSSSIIPTIAFEITRRFPEVKIPIALTATNDLWIFDLSLDEQMKKLVVEPLQAASNIVKKDSESYRFPQLFLIHGLEDCHDEDFQELFLYAFGKSLTQLQQYIPHKLILLGRHTAHLQDCFSKPEMEKIVRHRLLPVSQDVVV